MTAATGANCDLRAAAKAQHEGDLETAEVYYRRLLRAEPDQPLVRYFLGALLAQCGGDSLNEALALARQAVAGQSNNPG